MEGGLPPRTDKLAAGCWASTVIADQASASNAAVVRIDVKSRSPSQVADA